MSSEAKALLVTCPHCKAATKVVGLPETKTSIHCPKCKAEVSLKSAKVLKDRAPVLSVPQATAADYRRTLRGKGGQNSAGVAIGLLLGLVVAFGGLGGYYFFGPKAEAPKDLPHERAYADLIATYNEATERMNQLPDVRAAMAWDNQLLVFQNRIVELTRRVGELPAAEERFKERLRELEKDLEFARAKFDEARRRLAAMKAAGDPLLDPQQTAENKSTSTAPRASPTSSVAAAATATSPATGPASAGVTTPTSTSPAFPFEKTVTMTILNLPKERFTTEFLERIGTWTDSSPHSVRPQWSGDLLTIEVAPVSDLARFASRVNFGRVTRLDSTQRAITVLARADNDPDAEIPSDPFQLLLRDLRSEDQARRKTAIVRLKLMRPNDYRREVIKTLEPMLHDKDLEIRQEAIRAYGHWGGSEAVPPLLALLSEDNPAIYRPVIDMLGVIKDPRAAEPLARKWFMREPEAVSAALIAIGPAAEEAMIEQLNNPSLPLRIAACQVLRRIGTRASLGPLLKLTDEKTGPLTEAAWQAIEAIAARKGGR